MRVKARMLILPTVAVVLATGWGCGGGSGTVEKPIPPAVVEPAKVEPTPASPVKPCEDPSPGPIIVLTPTDSGGKLMAAWTFDADGSAVPQGADDKVSIRFIGRLHEESGSPVGFRLKRKSLPDVEYPGDVTIQIKSGQTKSLRLRRENIAGEKFIEWRFGSPPPSPLGICDDVEENCVTDCTDRKNTLPSKVFGEIVSITTDLESPVDLSDLDWIRIQADVQHPCP